MRRAPGSLGEWMRTRLARERKEPEAKGDGDAQSFKSRIKHLGSWQLFPGIAGRRFAKLLAAQWREFYLHGHEIRLSRRGKDGGGADSGNAPRQALLGFGYCGVEPLEGRFGEPRGGNWRARSRLECRRHGGRGRRFVVCEARRCLEGIERSRWGFGGASVGFCCGGFEARRLERGGFRLPGG